MNNNALLERLHNWKLWAKASLKSPVSCRSLENRYKCPQVWHPEEPKTFIDILDAVQVEKAIVKLPRQQLNIIVYAHIKSGYNFDAFCSKNSIRGNKHVSKTEQFQIELHRAETMLKNILYKGIDTPNYDVYKQGYNLNPEHSFAAV